MKRIAIVACENSNTVCAPAADAPIASKMKIKNERIRFMYFLRAFYPQSQFYPPFIAAR